MEKWLNIEKGPKVSVICTVYNHQKYISKALDSFLLQETDFPFEIIVHDDSSTDNSARIIEKYATKYPDIVIPIYQKDNKTSKGHNLMTEYILPRINGEYVAFCEGDDYWVKRNKLQLMSDYMDENPSCSLVSHLTQMINMSTGSKTIFNPRFLLSGGIIKNDEIIIETNLIHTSSFFLRKAFFLRNMQILQSITLYDAVYVMLAATEGHVYLIPEVMSVYRYRTEGSWSCRIADDDKKLIDVRKDLIKSARLINKYRGYKYNKAFLERNRRATFEIYMIQGDISKLKKKKFRDLYKKMSVTDHVMVLIRLLPKPVRRFMHDKIRPHLLGLFFRMREYRGFIGYKR